MNSRKRLDTISLNTDCDRRPGGDGRNYEQTTAAGMGRVSEGCVPDLLAQVSAEKRLLVKLLYIEDFTLAPEDIQLLAQRSGRAVGAVVEQVEEARASVRAREAGRRDRLEEAESAAQWILRYQRQLGQIRYSLDNLPPESSRAERLREEQAVLQRKQAWREQQRQRALRDGRRAVVTLRYREIAEILNMPVGSVSAQIARLRQELLDLAAAQGPAAGAPDGGRTAATLGGKGGARNST